MLILYNRSQKSSTNGIIEYVTSGDWLLYKDDFLGICVFM